MTLENSEYNLSFAGCGFLGLYHAGVCGCIQEFTPHLYKGQKVSGASAGAIAAAFLVCDIKLSDCVHYMMQTINTARSYCMGPFDPRFKITQHLREGLDLYLPEDAHIRCSGHLYISMTNQETHENYIAQSYKDRNELIKAILCSSYIPIFSGFIPLTFRGEWMIDGALTKNMLELDSNTITISPFSGEADICPRDDWGCGQIYIAGTSFLVNPNNMQRIINIFWPKSPEELGKLTQQGYSDALHFLARKGFIKCELHRCHTIFLKVKKAPEHRITDEHCKKCRKNIKRAMKSALSKSILSSFRPMELAVEKQIFKYFKLLTQVATLPIIIINKIIQRCVTLLKISHWYLIGSLLDVVQTLLSFEEVFKQALSKALESSHRPSYLCEALETIHVTDITDGYEFQYNEELDYSDLDSEESLFDIADSELFVPKNIINCEDDEPCQDQLRYFDETFETVSTEFPSEDRINLKRRTVTLGNEKIGLVSTRGVADGKDCDAQSVTDSECPIVYSNSDMHLNMDHQMTWSCPNIADSSDINYYILAPVIDSSGKHSLESF